VFLSLGATSPLNRRAERPIGFLPRRFPVQYIIHSIEGFLRGQPGRSRNETTRRRSRRSRALRSNHRDAQPAVKSFDVVLFWISPRRGRTNQPRATPGEWEFPRNTCPERAEQGGWRCCAPSGLGRMRCNGPRAVPGADLWLPLRGESTRSLLQIRWLLNDVAEFRDVSMRAADRLSLRERRLWAGVAAMTQRQK
jgi:hypothetical protein